MFKFLLIISLISKIHSWTWYDYPPPRHSYYTCGVWYPSYVCDPDFMLNSHQRDVIVRLVEDFKEKTKRPNSTIPCMREGLRLVVALARDKIGYDDTSSGITNLCLSARLWTLSDTTNCDSDLHGIELNSKGFSYCHMLHWEMILNKDKYQTLNSEGNQQLNNNNHFDVLRDYIIKLQMLYIHRFSIFDNPDASNEAVKISRTEKKQPLHEGQGERHGTKTLSQLSSDVEENNLKLFEMRELIGDYKAQQSSNNL